MAIVQTHVSLALPRPGESLGLRMSNLNEVLDIDPSGLACAAGLRKNDRIFSIDGRLLVSSDGSISAVAPLLKRGPADKGHVERKLVVLRASAAPTAGGGEVVTIAISRDERGSLGFNVTPDNIVSALKPGGVAEVAGMHVGDEVVAVDDSPLPPGTRLGAVMLRSRATYKVSLVRSKGRKSGEAKPPTSAASVGGALPTPAPPPPASRAHAPPPVYGNPAAAAIAGLPGLDHRAGALPAAQRRSSASMEHSEQSDGYMSLLSDTSRMLLSGGAAGDDEGESGPPSGGGGQRGSHAPPREWARGAAAGPPTRTLSGAEPRGSGASDVGSSSGLTPAPSYSLSRGGGGGAGAGGGGGGSSWASGKLSCGDDGAPASSRARQPVPAERAVGLGPPSLPKSLRYALLRKDGTSTLATAPLQDGGGLRPREVLLRTVAAAITARDGFAWAASGEAASMLETSARAAAQAPGGVWERSLRDRDLEGRESGRVGTASAVCAEVLKVGESVIGFRPGDLAVLSCPPSRANTAFLGAHNGWHRSPHGVVGCPLASVLCVPEDNHLDAGYGLAKVPKGLNAEDALLAAEAMIPGDERRIEHIPELPCPSKAADPNSPLLPWWLVLGCRLDACALCCRALSPLLPMIAASPDRRGSCSASPSPAAADAPLSPPSPTRLRPRGRHPRDEHALGAAPAAVELARRARGG